MALDPHNFLSYSYWLGLPLDTRYKIANLFGIKPNGIREVFDSRVISDGFRHADLAVITKEKMSELTGVKSDDFYVQFVALVEFVNKPKVEPEIKQQDVQQEKPAEVKPRAEKKVRRARKGAKA